MTTRKVGKMTLTLPSDTDVELTRAFDAPRELLFQAYTDARAIPEWWGPGRYTTTVDKMDVRPDGEWRYIQSDSKGNEFAFRGVYKEIVRPERIVYTFEWEAMPGHIITETVTFHENAGRTTLTARAVFQSKEDRDGMVQHGMEDGAAEGYDRLEEFLKKMGSYLTEKAKEGVAPAAASGGELVITRVFDAPRELVWMAWSDIKAFQRWWGPKGYTSPNSRMDFRIGGKYLFSMRSPEGQVFWSTGVYREIVPKGRIVFTDNFADENGNIVPASQLGLPEDWPKDIVITVLFEETGAKTKMTLRQRGVPSGAMSDMTSAGWNESFDKLAESLR